MGVIGLRCREVVHTITRWHLPVPTGTSRLPFFCNSFAPFPVSFALTILNAATKNGAYNAPLTQSALILSRESLQGLSPTLPSVHAHADLHARTVCAHNISASLRQSLSFICLLVTSDPRSDRVGHAGCSTLVLVAFHLPPLTRRDITHMLHCITPRSVSRSSQTARCVLPRPRPPSIMAAYRAAQLALYM